MSTDTQGKKGNQGIEWDIEEPAEVLLAIIVTIASTAGIWSLNFLPFTVIS